MSAAPSLAEAPLGSRPTALILSGGAALGAWQGGVLWALEKAHGLTFSQVLGTSAGSVNGVAYLQGSTELLRELWRDVPREAFLHFSPRLTPPSLFSLESVGRYLGTILSEERCRAARRCWFYAVAADVATGKTVQAEYSPEPGGPWDGPLLDHILGSIAVPFVFPPWPVNAVRGGAQRLFVDGHATCFIDLAPLVARGARDLLFVSVIAAQGRARPALGPRGFVSTLINTLMRAQVDNGLAALNGAREKGVRVFEFCPSTPLDMSVFLFKRAECRRAFEQGVADATALVGDPGRYRLP